MSKKSMTSFDKDISMEINEDEELLWQGAPQKASFILSKSVQLLPIALIWLCFDGFAISMIFRSNVPKSMLIFLIIFFAFHLMPVWIWIHNVLSARRKHKLIEYALTNQRVIVQDGGILKSYYYSELHHVSVKVGFIDKLFKVGDLTLKHISETTRHLSI
ncbi:MAG: PH domain-containing protein, partial [Clostridia bacterium]|nr:PH domain-containing protein [Clostridia bacterium]